MAKASDTVNTNDDENLPPLTLRVYVLTYVLDLPTLLPYQGFETLVKALEPC